MTNVTGFCFKALNHVKWQSSNDCDLEGMVNTFIFHTETFLRVSVELRYCLTKWLNPTIATFDLIFLCQGVPKLCSHFVLGNYSANWPPTVKKITFWNCSVHAEFEHILNLIPSSKCVLNIQQTVKGSQN
jgi:hypothetical protein